MYPDRIDVIFIIMYRTAHLIEFAELITGEELPWWTFDIMWAMAEQTINELLMEPDFQCFPSWPTSCPALSNVH